METAKHLPFSGFHRAFGNIFVPLMGGLLLATLALKYSRSSQDNLATSAALSIALGALVVAVSYVKFRRALERLKGTVSEDNLAILNSCANAMVIFGYGACATAMVFLSNGVHR